MKTIIILGGRAGRIVTANHWSSQLKGKHKIILIEKNHVRPIVFLDDEQKKFYALCG